MVHGHGSGKLRQAVRERLRSHRGVAGLREGAPNEGGNGATKESTTNANLLLVNGQITVVPGNVAGTYTNVGTVAVTSL